MSARTPRFFAGHRRSRVGREVMAAVSIAALCLVGCAGSTSPGASAPQASSASLEEERYQCVPHGDAPEPSASEEERRSAELDGAAPVAADGAPEPESAARPSQTAGAPPPTSTESAAVDWFQLQAQELGALACALDAADCATGSALGDRICDLAQRVCALDAADERCAEATRRCERARARIRLACPERD